MVVLPSWTVWIYRLLQLQFASIKMTHISDKTQSTLFRGISQDGEVQEDYRSKVPYGNYIDDHHLGIALNPDSLLAKGTEGLGKDFSNSFSSRSLPGNYENDRYVQHEQSSSIVSQTVGVPDLTFDSIDSPINDGSFLNRSPWAPPPPPPQFHRMRTYT